VNLYALAFSCYIYNNFTTFNLTFTDFFRAIDGKLNLADEKHRKLLIAWLNKWGCRQFSHEYRDKASQIIAKWYADADLEKIPSKKTLWELSKHELEVIAPIYDSLVEKTASHKARHGKNLRISVGPTGASKILFALRPEVAAPWDEAMRVGLRYDGSGESYINYLQRIRADVEALDIVCRKEGIALSEIPGVIGRADSTLVQLIGEYYWITETRKLYPPKLEVLSQWHKWAE
jgi:hypothetical protein